MYFSSGGLTSSTTFFFRFSGEVDSCLPRADPSALAGDSAAALTDCRIGDAESPDVDRETISFCGGGGFKYFCGIRGVGTGGMGTVFDLPEWKLSEREGRNNPGTLGLLAGVRSSEPFETGDEASTDAWGRFGACSECPKDCDRGGFAVRG